MQVEEGQIHFRQRISSPSDSRTEWEDITKEEEEAHCLHRQETRKRELFFEIFVLLYAVLVNLMEIMDGIDEENSFLLDDELNSDTDISSNYLDYSSDDSCSELSSDEDLSSFFSSPLGIILFYKKWRENPPIKLFILIFPLTWKENIFL
ncbi:uncharacterized protein NPIL_83061 [Nephila pilipes]|uniref:Uncharacterized protein n=1 Tax=Nephila pilipes TaxID=299642 RepID=A0A8X6R2H1_NEPPI|nr:uncharacterized protein NPIL_83061 [Nephila pilipes]